MQTLFKNVVVAVLGFFDRLVVESNIGKWESFFTQQSVVLTLLSSFLLLISVAIVFVVNANRLLFVPFSRLKGSSFDARHKHPKRKNTLPHKTLESWSLTCYPLEKIFSSPPRRIEEIVSEKKILQTKVYESPQFLQFYNALLTIASRNEFIKKAVDIFCETSSGKFASLHLRKSRLSEGLHLSHFYSAQKNSAIAKEAELLAHLEAPVSLEYGEHAQYCNSLIPHILEVQKDSIANKGKNAAFKLLCIPLAHPPLFGKEANWKDRLQDTKNLFEGKSKWVFGHLQIFIKNASLEKCAFYIELAHQLSTLLTNFNKKQNEIWMPHLHVFTLSHLLSTINTIGFIKKNSGYPPMPSTWLLHPVFHKPLDTKTEAHKENQQKASLSKTTYERIMYSFFKQMIVERQNTDSNFLGVHYHPNKQRVFCISRSKSNAQTMLAHILKKFNSKNTNTPFRLEFFPIDLETNSFPISETDLLKRAENITLAGS